MDIQKELVKVTKQLISMPTVSSQIEENRKALRWITEYMDLPKDHVRYYKNTNYPSLVIVTNPHAKKIDIIFHGHVDVVPTIPEEFIPREEDGIIYGRGATDMKGGLAVLIILFQKLIQEKTDKNFALMITSDEEVQGLHGTKYLLDHIGYTANFFITAEGCSLKHSIITKAKGMLIFYLEATGKPNHGSRTWLGENAIELLYKAYQDIATLFPSKDSKEYWHSTINLATVSGGEAINSIPYQARAGIDIRFTEDWESGSKILAAIEKKLKNHSRVKIANILVNDALLYTDRKNTYVRKLAQAFKKRAKYISKPIGFAHGTSDARFAARKGIPAVEFGPKGENAHAQHESIKIGELERYYAILEDFIATL